MTKRKKKSKTRQFSVFLQIEPVRRRSNVVFSVLHVPTQKIIGTYRLRKTAVIVVQIMKRTFNSILGISDPHELVDLMNTIDESVVAWVQKADQQPDLATFRKTHESEKRKMAERDAVWRRSTRTKQ